jgi:hypothetical protein
VARDGREILDEEHLRVELLALHRALVASLVTPADLGAEVVRAAAGAQLVQVRPIA